MSEDCGLPLFNNTILANAFTTQPGAYNGQTIHQRITSAENQYLVKVLVGGGKCAIFKAYVGMEESMELRTPFLCVWNVKLKIHNPLHFQVRLNVQQETWTWFYTLGINGSLSYPDPNGARHECNFIVDFGRFQPSWNTTGLHFCGVWSWMWRLKFAHERITTFQNGKFSTVSQIPQEKQKTQQDFIYFLCYRPLFRYKQSWSKTSCFSLSVWTKYYYYLFKIK